MLVITQDKKEAVKFFQRKIDYVTKNLEKMQGVLIEKMKMRESKSHTHTHTHTRPHTIGIVNVMQMKISSMDQSQTAAK